MTIKDLMYYLDIEVKEDCIIPDLEIDEAIAKAYFICSREKLESREEQEAVEAKRLETENG